MSHLHRFIILGALVLSGQLHVYAQESGFTSEDFKERKEKAIAELKNFPNPDTARINALLRILGTATFLKERQELTPYRMEALALSRKLNYIPGLGQCYLSMANLHKSASEYTQALQYYDSVLYIIGDDQSRRILEMKAWTYHQKGMVYYSQDNYYTSLDNFFEALKYVDYMTLKRNIHINSFIVEIYTALNNLDKAMEYAKKSITLVESDSSALFESNVFFSIIDLYFAKNDLDNAAFYLEKVKPYIPDKREVQMNFGYYMKVGILQHRREQYDSAFYNYQLAYKYALMGNHRNSLSTILRLLAGTALKLGDDETAKAYAIQSLELAEKSQAKSLKVEALVSLSAYYHKKGNDSKAFELQDQAMRLKDSLLSETNVRQINTLTAMYEADKQQKEIIRLQNEKAIESASVKQKSMLNTVFIILITALLILGYLGFTNFKKSQKIGLQQQWLQQQKINELEKDNQLLTIDAMLQGQEEERSRIAKDLHDGLGSLLSGTKLSFMNVKENLVLSPENTVLFDRSLSMLDNTISDLRKVAQNLMPEALVKFGLHEAVRDFCDSIRYSSGIKVMYQELGEKRKLDNTAEVFAYRIIQELVNNAVKHASASMVIVQLTMSKDKVGITVEDDGKGFEKSKLAHTKGAGMANIYHRLKYFNGTIDIVTSPGNGTSVTIELIA